MKNERRNSNRLPWVRFESRVCVRRSLFKKEWIPVVPFDFSRYGMGIQTDEEYGVEEEMLLSLELEKDGATRFIPHIRGVVRYKEKHHSRFNYGVEFVFGSKADKQAADEDLLWIEKALQSYEAAKAAKSESSHVKV